MHGHSPSVFLVKVPVRDFERGVSFYRDILGLEPQYVVPEYHWASFALGNLSLALYRSDSCGGDVGFHISVSDLHGLAEQLKEKGVTIVREYGQDADGSFSLKIADPDRNELLLLELAPGVAEQQ